MGKILERGLFVNIFVFFSYVTTEQIWVTFTLTLTHAYRTYIKSSRLYLFPNQYT
jgi:hypothetical protein